MTRVLCPLRKSIMELTISKLEMVITKKKTYNSCLKLSNILYDPNVTQNLIFISQLFQINKVSIEFFPWHFEVKDLSTKEILLR